MLQSIQRGVLRVLGFYLEYLYNEVPWGDLSQQFGLHYLKTKREVFDLTLQEYCLYLSGFFCTTDQD